MRKKPICQTAGTDYWHHWKLAEWCHTLFWTKLQTLKLSNQTVEPHLGGVAQDHTLCWGTTVTGMFGTTAVRWPSSAFEAMFSLQQDETRDRQHGRQHGSRSFSLSTACVSTRRDTCSLGSLPHLVDNWRQQQTQPSWTANQSPCNAHSATQSKSINRLVLHSFHWLPLGDSIGHKHKLRTSSPVDLDQQLFGRVSHYSHWSSELYMVHHKDVTPKPPTVIIKGVIAFGEYMCSIEMLNVSRLKYLGQWTNHAWWVKWLMVVMGNWAKWLVIQHM